MGTSLSDIRDTVNENLDENFLNNNKIKMFLSEIIEDDDIQFWKPYAKNQSLLFFYAKLSMQDVVQRPQSINMYKEVALNLRDILLPTSFDIDGKFGDTNELEHSWENMNIPEELVYFFITLFKLPQTKLFNQYDPNDESHNFKDRKVTKLKALYQITFYMIHNGKRKTPFHLMVSHNIYEKCKSQEVITALSRTGMCVSYNELMSAREDLPRCTIAESKDCHIPLPSQFTKENFAFAAFDNFDHQDQSTTSGKFSNHDTVMTLYQLKPEKTHSKLRKNEIDLANINLKEKLPCQELMSYNSVNKDIVLPSNMIIPIDLLEDTDSIKKHKDTESAVDMVHSDMSRM